jgi:hypothetical protein
MRVARPVASASLDPDHFPSHFFVDIATSLPQYLVCKHATAPFVALTENWAPSDLNLLRRHSRMATKKKAAKKKKKK